METQYEDFDDFLMHYGVLHKSGRYPWGSGDNPSQRNRGFLDYVDGLRKDGLTEASIAEGMGITTTQLRAARSIAKNQQKLESQRTAVKLKEKGMSNIAIGKQMELNESTVRSLLNPHLQEKADILGNTANMLKEEVDAKKVIDIGTGVERHLNLSRTQFDTAVAMLEEEGGYKKSYVQVEQLGTGNKTTIKVLSKDDVPYGDIARNPDQIGSLARYSEDGGRNFNTIKPPLVVDSKRVEVRYGSDGGSDMDGVIQVRRGVDDLSMGAAKYAQVRIAVDGTHYLKGMAMYTDDLPDGVDLRFNTNKEDTGNKLKAMKPMKDDPNNPFGAIVSQIQDHPGPTGKPISAMNIVNEEGDWNKWSKSLSSQVLSKQSPALARQQLELRLREKQQALDEVMKLTNPAVKQKLLDSMADDLDSSAVHLKAAALPRQRTQVILPINSMKDTEVYAPQFRDGESVVLIRYPHGGKFEIPELTVNNKNREANSVIKQAKDAVGINSKVASRHSGADFDGDTVLVIPNNARAIKTQSPLKGLEGFDPQSAYPKYPGMKPMSPRTKQLKMGDVSNLITDMTIRGASPGELARAVRHSMVVIDAEKHELDWQRSAKDNGISDLKKKYQGSAKAGASTLVSQASSRATVDDRRARRASMGGPIDPLTGKKVYEPTNESYVNAKGETVVKKIRSTKMAETDDATTLFRGQPQPIEVVYADYANKVKAMANQARREQLAVRPIPYSPTAKKTYSKEVERLNADLNIALRNAPLERQAQLIANARVKAERQAKPDMDAAQLKKTKGLALEDARNRVGAKKVRVPIDERQWEAIQAGAVTHSKLVSILANADPDRVKELATPRNITGLSSAAASRGRAMLNSGYTQAEVAEALGVSSSTVNDLL